MTTINTADSIGSLATMSDYINKKFNQAFNPANPDRILQSLKPEEGSSIKLAKGIWDLEKTIIIPSYCRITLEAGAKIVRTSNSKEPFFRFAGRHASLVGESKNVIQAQGTGFSKGLIYFGHEELNSNTFDSPNCSYNQLSNIHLKGDLLKDPNITPDKESSDGLKNNESIGVYFNSNQKFTLAQSGDKIRTIVYFNTISDCVFSYLRQGIYLKNFCNGNCFDNLVFDRVGNNPDNYIHTGHSNGGSAINFHNGSGQNRISNIQHHFALNSTSFHFTHDENSNLNKNSCSANIVNGLIAEGERSVAIRIDNVNAKKTYENLFIMHSNGGTFIDGNGDRQHRKFIPDGHSYDDYFNSSTNNNCIITSYKFHPSRMGTTPIHN